MAVPTTHRLALRVSPTRRVVLAALVVVLLTLPLLAFWGAYESLSAGFRSHSAIEADQAFQSARYQIALEASAERRYLADPRPEVLAEHARAGAALDATLRRLIALEPSNRAELDDLLARHARYGHYAQAMFAAVDANDVDRANRIDDDEADPLFASIGQVISSAAAAHRLDARQQLQRLLTVQRIVLVSTPMVLLIGVCLTLLFLKMLRRIRRDMDAAQRDALTRSEQRLQALVANTSDAILVCDVHGTIVYEALTRRPDPLDNRGKLVGTSLFGPVHPADRTLFEELLCAVAATPRSTRTIEARTSGLNGSWRHIEFTLTNLLDEPTVDAIVATASDISERKHAEMLLARRAFYDTVTDLPNRALLHDRLRQALSHAQSGNATVGIAFVDLDNFKRVNDSLGHHVGDRLLVAAAQRLGRCVRREDTVARLGGDEFVVLFETLAGDGLAEGALIAKTIVEQFNLPFVLDGKRYNVGVSVGLAMTRASHARADADTLLRDADVAMYRAKQGGKARYVIFEETMHVEAVRRLELESDLRHALEHDELCLHYQPIMRLQSDGFRGMEALVRWQHPTRGLLPPSEFIDIAEESGLIVPLGRWVLGEACRQIGAWQRQYGYIALQVSVNLSPGQLEDPHLIDDVVTSLANAGIGASALKLEVTEGLMMRDAARSIDTLRALRALGVSIALDDFGTGYSSLSYLRSLPLDTLKIDRSFIKGIGVNAEDDAIVRAVIVMAKALGLTVTAEGIETVEQAQLLREWSCETAQGYLFSRPLPASEFARLVSCASSGATMLRAMGEAAA